MSEQNDGPRAPRVPLRIKVEYECLDDFLDDYTANMSMGGMFVRSEHPLPTDTTFRLRFRLPERASLIEATATVQWVVEPGDPTGLEPGMGIQFDGLADSDQRAIERWLRRYERELRACDTVRTGSRAA